MKSFLTRCVVALVMLAFTPSAYGDGLSRTKQSRTGSLDPVNTALDSNYGQMVRAAQVRSGVQREGRIVRAGVVDVPVDDGATERAVIRRGPAFKLMNP